MLKIGCRIKELRRELNCTQNKLADVLGVTQDSISLWENGKRIPDTQYVVGMAEFFDVTTDYLLGISDDFGGVRFSVEDKAKNILTQDELCLLNAYRRLDEIKKKEWMKKIDK